MTSSWRRAVATLHYLIPLALGQYTPLSRWGQAVALLENDLYVHGGLTDQYDQYSYTSAPPTSEVLLLDLSVSFSAASPPWQLLSNTTTTSSSPALGWHTLSAFNTSSLLLFGGQPGPNSQTVLTSLNDSAALVSAYDRTDPSFVMEPQNWAGEPTRRIRHSASSTSGEVWIVGGEKADGSGNSFSDHYVFYPASQEFVILPSGGNAPSDIYGHASLVLPDGRLIVLGGYCASCGDLIPMNTIWSLDTTQSTLAWNTISVSTSTLPNPRRDFAAVVLATGEILIHGGGDGALQTTYSDGWILNTTQNPMVWQEVQSLQQLGARTDHMAIQCNGQVLFAFGYGSSAPASATMQIYNPSSSSMVPSYSPPPAGSTPAINSLPAPSQTGNSGPGATGSAGATAVYPTSTAIADASSDQPNIIVIALGTTFGVFGLVAGGLAAAWYIKRSRERESLNHGRFFLLGGDLENERTDGSTLNLSTMRDSNEKEYQRSHGIVGAGVFPLAVLTHLGLSKHSPPEPAHPRRDMFADEDTQQFGWVGSRPGMSRREGSGGTSAWSLHSMRAIVRGMMSREPSTGNSGREWDEWEKIEDDHEGLIHEDKLLNVMPNSGRLHGRDGSSWSYTDPFSDPVPNDREYDAYQPHLGALEFDSEYDNVEVDDASRDPSPLRPQRTSSLSAPIHALSPLHEISHTTASHALTSYPDSSQDNSISKGPPSSNTNSSQPSSPSQPSYGAGIPRISYTSTPTIALSHRHSSVLDSYPPSPTSHPIHRSDSWWGRFMKTPLLDRRISTGQKPLDFRDPNSAPRLMSIEESKASSDALESNDDLAVKHCRVNSSSLQSSRTANTEGVERLGGSYDVVQRIASDESTSHRKASTRSISTNELGLLGLSEQGYGTSSSSIPTSNLPYSLEEHPKTASGSLSAHSSRPIRAAGHAVSHRVQEFERQMTILEAEHSPRPRNSRKREEVPSRTRPNIKYGLALRPSLYVTNPDRSVPTS
ncbi:hypothetical protein AZE42_05102 [Rhizopogon vesiculosus]|uniref:Galactose oxidase n=1 Tax=Rhizopogon vesiculosus TaxID=180088 RepID=A0A1J8QUM6_9AGAM|nr:hypothetical protein AZE42_05102 [Rhizopogon vesiculosus]